MAHPTWHHPIFIDAPYYGPKRSSAIKKWLGALCLTLLSILAFTWHTKSYAETNETSELSSGELTFKNTQGVTQQALLMDTKISAGIHGVIAEITYEQHFINRTNEWQEGIYQFPLPENASVNFMQMQIGERIISGHIAEKQAAKQAYKAALAQGKKAALTEQNRPNLFTQRVANIAPNETIVVTLRFLQTLKYENEKFEWRLPTTFTPRYIPGAPIAANDEEQPLKLTSTGWAIPTDQVIDADEITPPMVNATANGVAAPTMELKISLNAGLQLANIQALYHEISITKLENQHQISLTNTRETMDRDFVLQWSPVKSQAPQAAVFTEEIDGEIYALMMLMPPSTQTHNLPRDIVFIIDTSGSMGGTSITQAKSALTFAMDHLAPTDRFNIIEFNSNFSLLFNDWSQANQQSIDYAKHWIHQLNATGGTEMWPAFDAALNHSTNSNRLQQIVFITDGAVGNESALFSHIHQRIGDFRLFTVGIGSAPNSHFMSRAAEIGRGTFTYIGDVQEVTQTMADLFQKLNSASHTEMAVDWGSRHEQYPEHIGELYFGQPLLVTAKLDALHDITITGQSQVPWSQALQLDKPNHDAGIAALWARQKIKALESEGLKGKINNEELKSQITEVALKHQLLSRFTSFIAIEETPSKPAEEKTKTSPIANAIPQGQTLQALPYPKTATWSGLLGWLACLTLFLSAILFAIKREPETSKQPKGRH